MNATNPSNPRHLDSDAYLSWYFNCKPTTFASLLEFTETVGPRPGPEWRLTRTVKPRDTQVPLSADNFLWITDEARQAAQNGQDEPPRFPPTHADPTRQTINNARWRAFYANAITRARIRQGKTVRKAELEYSYTLLLDKITDYVTSKGYSATDALNPQILPADTHPKLNAARAKLQLIMDELTGELQKRESLAKWHEKQRQQRMEQKLVRQANRLATPITSTARRGRPIQPFVQKRVPIADLTLEQKQQYGIDPDATFIETQGAKRRGKLYSLTLMVPNPKYTPDTSPEIADTTPTIPL